MKTFTLQLAGMLALFFCWAAPALHAQESGAKKGELVIVQKIENEDGSITTVKKRIQQGEDVETIIEEFKGTEGENVEVHILSDGQNVEVIQGDEGESVFFFRRAREHEEGMEEMERELKQMNIIIHEGAENQEMNFDWKFDRHESHGSSRTRTEEATKAFLGIYPDDTDNGTGVEVDGVVSGSAAAAAGLQEGDVILSISGQATNGDYGLKGVLSKLEPGSQQLLAVLRDGQELQLPVTLGEKTYTRRVYDDERAPCKVFIGVYVGGKAAVGRGVQVTGIIGNTPAEESGVLAGDVILTMDGIAVNNNEELLTERNKHEPGQYFDMTILRSGQEMNIEAQFKSCDEEQAPAEEETIIEEAPAPEAPALELPENSLELQNYNAYPNPTFGDVTVQFQADAVPTVIQLSDSSGRIIFQRQLNRFDGFFNEELNLRSATPGNLTLTIRQGDKLITKQLVLLNRA